MVMRLLLLFLLFRYAAPEDVEFRFNGFLKADLTLDQLATITTEGLLRLTNATKLAKSHAFFPTPLRFRRSPGGNVSSFSSTFVFEMIPKFANLSGHGIALFFSPSKNLSGALGNQYMDLFNPSNDGNSSNHVFAVELDTVQNPELEDINANHVGININSMRSNKSTPAGYFPSDGSEFKGLSLISGRRQQVWVEYDGDSGQLNVTLAPIEEPKPKRPLLSSTTNLSDVFLEQMFVGFSSSSDPFLTSHYIAGWSFKMNGEAPALNLSALPSLPLRMTTTKSRSWLIWASVALGLVVLGVAAGTAWFVRKIRFSEILDDWEQEYGPNRFAYKDLFIATDGFSNKGLLGTGGFGKVHRGVLPKSNVQVAVKRVSHDSRQGVKEFVAEIISMGRLRHRNLVQLLGYCRRRGELLLVYEFMPHGSLDKMLFDQNPPRLDWNQRFRIIKGVASGLLYLHEGWEQVVIHRDVKASNVLLDADLNGRLGDFGLAKLFDHGETPLTTRVVGTMGYLAPELAKTGKADKATDVFAFGVFLLEAVSGRRPLESPAPEEEVVLVDWVVECWNRGAILDAADRRLSYDRPEEVNLVLKLGLLCSDPMPTARPTMRQVVQFLDGDAPLPEFVSNYLNNGVMSLLYNEAWDSNAALFSAVSATRSFPSGGR